MKDRKERILNSVRSRFGRTVILTLVAVFLLVIAAAVVAVSISLGKDLRQSIAEKKEEQFRMVESGIDQRLNELSGILYGVVSDENFYIVSDPVVSNAGYRMVAALSKYLKGNDFASYLGYYRLSDPDKVYTTAGEMDLTTFLDVHARTGMPAQTFLQKVMDTSTARYYPATFRPEDSRYITVASTLPQFSRTPRAAVIAFVDQRGMTSLVEPLYLDCYGAFWIETADGTQVYRYCNVQEDLTQISVAPSDTTMDIFGETYMVQSFENVEFGWRCTSLIRQSDIMESANNRQIQLCTIIAAIVLCAGTFLVVFVLRQYSPINQLARSVSGQIQNDGAQTAFDEQILLSNAFRTLLEEKNNNYLEMFYTNLLAQQYDAESVRYAMGEYNIHFEYPYFTTMAIHTGRTDLPPAQRRALCAGVEERICQEDMWCHALLQPNAPNVLVFLNHGKPEISKEIYAQIVSELEVYLKTQFQCGFTMGVGNTFASALQWGQSQRQAVNAMYFCKMENVGKYLPYSAVENSGDTATLLSYKMRLLSACRKGNVPETEQVALEIRQQHDKRCITASQLNYLIYDILVSLPELTEDADLTRQLDSMLRNLLDKHRIDQAFFEMVVEKCLCIASQRYDARQSQKDELLERIRRFMDEHLCDNTLCLESIAADCGISASYLSRYFKQNMNCTPMSYVDNARMELVKEKLAQTDLPLRQILEEVGYIDQSNFIRKFKRIEGMTPSAYRQIYQDGNA